MTNEYAGQMPPFTALPNWLRGKTTPLELAVMWCLQSHFPNIHPGLELLHEEAGMAKSTLCSVLIGLERKGWVRRQRAFLENGRSTSTRYRLTIWDTHWQVEAEQSAWSVREADSTECPGGGQLKVSGRRTVSVREADSECPGGGQEVDKSKKINSKKVLEPPLPPAAQGEHRPEAGAARPCRDRDGFLVSDPEPHDEAPAAVQPQPQQRPQPQSPPRPLPEPPGPEAVPPVKPQAQKRETGFVPTVEDVPAALLPVQRELLAFWPARNPKAKRTQQAWKGMLTEARKIQDHHQGGTEILRAQLVEGAEARVSGPGWLGLNFNRWQQYGTKAGTPMGGTGRYGKRTTMDRVQGAIALIEQRERAAAARAQQQAAGQGALMLAEVA